MVVQPRTFSIFQPLCDFFGLAIFGPSVMGEKIDKARGTAAAEPGAGEAPIEGAALEPRGGGAGHQCTLLRRCWFANACCRC